MKQVKLHKNINDYLDEIVKARKKDGNPVCTKQGVMAELICKTHKKECK